MSRNLFRKGTEHGGASRLVAALATASLALSALTVAPGIAQAAIDSPQNTVTGVSPRGTTINLFDYWIQGRTDNDQNNGQNWQNRGINAGHVLKFGAGMGTEQNADLVDLDSINDWTGDAEPRQGIVASKLGGDGYPSLSGDGGIGTESLDYLFDSSSFDGKAAYTDVDGLLQVDEDGYYYYNSQENFAQFNDDGSGSGDFTLYDEWAVYPGGRSPKGQFFPFNTGEEVFNETNNGIEPKNIKSTNEVINHYFGIHMSTRFIQQDGGYNAPEGTPGRQAVTYNFSGDDDVWIYIDGVLVGDLGGIHDATSIEINFANNDRNSSGRVYVYDDINDNNQYDQGETIYNGNGQGQTLAEIMRAAGVTANLDGVTFADGTYHTLDFFYLERGNTDSNMSLKYNLVNIPESGIVKVDQYGTGLSGIQFTLQQANANYEAIEGTTPVTGRTNSNGEMIFTYENNAGQEIPITLEQLGSRSGYWILTETIDTATNGYRSVGTVKLRFSKINDDGTGDGVLLSSNQWETGAYSQAHVTATATTTVTDVDGGTYDPADGLMFAVVTKINNGEHYAVTGDAFSGWDVATTAIDDAATSKGAIVDAAKASGYIFLLGSGGAYQTTIEDLPGDITTYEYMIKNGQGSTQTAQYAVKYYWSDATSLDNLSDQSTIVEINPEAGQGFDRMFSVTLSIPNTKNELTLHKTNADGTDDLQGAVYTLYADENRNGQLDTGEQPVAENLTTDQNGMVEIYSNVDEKLLANGYYVLVETTAPADYVLDETPIQIVVDDDGVHVNAGTDSDNISVETGIGDLVYSMRGFAADDQIDATLHEVKAQPQTATAYEGEQTDWKGVDGVELHFQYRDETDDNRFTYQPSNGSDATYTADAGWSRFNVTQCMSDEHEGGNNTDYKQDLGNQSLNGLFTGDVTIHVTNEKVPVTSSLTIKKTVIGDDAPDGKAFDFNFKLTDADDNPVTGTFSATTHHADGTESTDELTITADNNEFSLADGESITISGLPIDTAYSVTEKATAYYESKATATYPSVTEVDDATGELKVTGTIPESGTTVAYTNTFFGSVHYDSQTRIDIVKTFTGRDMKQGETFVINVQPKDDASAKLIGLKSADDVLPVTLSGLKDGVKSITDLTDGKNMIFTKDNVGTYVYTVSEERPDSNPNNGITYDEVVYTVTIEATADAENVVTVKTTVSGTDGYNDESTITGRLHSSTGVDLPFENTYKAEGQLGGSAEGATSIKAHKTLENDTLAGDDFTFSVWSVNQDGDAVDELVKAMNGADGDIVFPAIVYTTDTLKSAVENGIAQEGANADGNTTYTYNYRVREDTSGFADEGLTTARAEFNVTVVVTDNGDGTLGIEVTYPQGYEDGLEFVNTYGEDASADLVVAGTKIYETNGFENAPGITGKYTFTLTGIDEDGDPAPLPAGAVDNAVTATNQPANSVSFGTIEYGIEDLKGKDSITFTYTVTEEGSVESVENDSEAATGKTFEVTLTDNQNGTISVDADAQQAAGQQFSFTNTYDAEPTVPTNPTDPATGNLTITKTLAGRALKEGEFSFTMSANGEYGEAVSPTSITATNTVNDDGTSSVVFGDGFTFNESGDYSFTISEDNNALGGVDYDVATYTAVAHVEDDGAGALTVTWTVTDAEDNEVSEITFANTYKAEATSASFGVSKELKGGALAEGQFSFELTGSEGAPMPEKTTVANAADGSVNFGEISYEKAGEYDYTITEVNDGQDGIVYDENVDRTVHVSVTDNGEGTLVAEVTFGEDGSHFVNEDTTSEDPKDPEDPQKPGEGEEPGDGEKPGKGDGSGENLAQTGDFTIAIVGGIVVVAAILVIVGVVMRRRS
ncbi:Spy0128 family protein [Collinsella tanakaei]|uniref:Spy0128 family protein n=1 Tax=Collinsella tanakaei TaxID=626935 RepID=UPI0025A4AF6C|nr:FctA domain-containing protein [Collinsella tanakaei]MDM8299555.1 FctA domain-containing protein [Collinsella tanakaei]